MANIRTIDYQGQKAAIGGYGPTGWILWSGSVADCTSSGGADTIYDGIGFEFIGSAQSYIRFAHIVGSAAEIDIRAQSFMVGVTGSGGQFISGSGGEIEISSSNFHLTPAGDVTMQGTITANAGSIGGFALSSNALTGTNFTLDTTDKRLTLGSGDAVAVLDADEGIFIGDAIFADAPFSVDTAGSLKAISGEIAQFTITSDTLGTTGYSGTTSGVALQAGATPSIIARKDESNYIRQYYDSVTDWGLQGYAASTALFQLGSTNQIAGWKFDSTKIISNLGANNPSSPGIVINSNGTIETDPFISGLTANATGWQIRADGRAEFENAVIRGTLSTAVFEKDTISVVGGQVMVANAAKIDTTNPRFIDYPFLNDKFSNPIHYSGEELPAANQIAKYNGSGTYRTSDFESNTSYQSDLWWKLSNPASNTHQQTFTWAETYTTSSNKTYRATFYHDKGDFTTGLTFKLQRMGYVSGPGNYQYSGTSGSFNGATYGIANQYTCIDGLNTLYFKGDPMVTSHKWQFQLPEAGTDKVGYVRDFHVTEISSSLTVDNAGGFAAGEIVVAKSTDQGPDGREGFVREYMRIQSASLGLSEIPASGTLDLSSTTISSGTVFHVTASKNYTFTGVASATADVPANNDYKYIVGANKSDTIRNIKNKIMEECLDTFAMVTGSTEGANNQLHLLSHGVGVDGNSYGIRQGATSVTLSGAVDRVKPTLVVERNLDALVSGNGMGYAIQRIKDGQSVASQGKAGTGYILMNAQPTDDNSPYIDIVERSSNSIGTEQHTENSQHSVFGDVKTVVRIGDLGGITDNSFSDGVSGYGIYTENGYFKGKLEITNPEGASMEHNFGGPSGSVISETELIADNDLVGPQWLNTQQTRHVVKNGGLFVSGSGDQVWTSELRSKQTFNRVDDHTFQSDFTTVNISNNQQMLGLGDTGTPSGTNGGNFSNTAHAIYINASGIKVYEGSTSMNSGTNIYSSVVANDRFRIIIKPHVDSKGAIYKLYKHPALITPVAIFDSKTEANAKQDLVLDAGIWSYRQDSERTFFENIKVLAPGQMTTTIEGDKITTGKIQSTNLSADSGSIYDLDDGTFKLGGTSDPKLSWDGTNLDIKGRITIEAGSIGPGGGVIETFETLAISSNTNVFGFDDVNDTSPTPSTATITVNQTNQSDNLVYGGSGASAGDFTLTNCTISNSGADYSFTQGANAGTGTATMTIVPSAYPVTVAVANGGLSDSIQLLRVNGGSGGSSGSNARSVNISTTAQAFQYETNDLSPSPGTSTITATAFQTTGTVYYEFIVDGTSTQNTTANTITYTPPTNFTDTPEIVEVKIREASNSSTVLANDQMTMIGLKEGTDAISISLSNSSHTLPTDSSNVVTYTNSGTDINVWIGTLQLDYEDDASQFDSSGANEFNINVINTTNITVDALPDTNANGYTREFGNASAFNTSGGAGTAKISFVVRVKDGNGTLTTFVKDQTFSWSVQGSQGIQGDAADDTINTASVFAYKRFAQGVSTDQPSVARDWNFANAAFTNTDLGNSWTPTIPTGADNLFMCTAIASGTGTTDQIAVDAVNGDGSGDWTTAQQLGAAGVPGEPAFTKTFPYDDYDTYGKAAGEGRYTFQTNYSEVHNAYASQSGAGGGAVNTDFSTAGAVMIHEEDYLSTDHSTYYDSLVVGDSITFYISADRWYHYTIKTIDPTPQGGDTVNWELEFVSENITLSGGETALSNSEATPPVNFRFQKAVDGTVGTNGVSTAVVYGYKRATSTPSDKPSETRTWTFASATWGNTDLGNSWEGDIPTGTDDLYVCTAVASSTGASDSVEAADWTSAQLLASNGVNGNPGTSAKTIVLTADANIFTEDITGTITPDFIKLTVNKQNTSEAVAWTVSPASPGVDLYTSASGGSAATVGDIIYIRKADFDALNSSVIITATCDGIVDSQTINKLEAGSGNIGTIMENESHVLPASTGGVVSSHAGSGTVISVFEGATPLDHDGSGTTDGHWTVSTTQSPSSTITIGGISNQANVVDNTKNDALVADHSGMVNGTDAVTITYTVSGKTQNGTAFSFTKTQSISKSKAGATGDHGDNAKTIVLSADANIFTEDAAGTITPDTIKFTVNKQNTTAAVAWVTSPSVTLYTAATGGATTTSGDIVYMRKAQFDSATPPVTVTATCDTIVDSQTINKLEAGSGNIGAILTNESHTFPAASNGAVSDYDGSGTTISVYEGATKLDYDESGTTAGHWNLSSAASPAHIVIGGGSGGTGEVGDDAVVLKHSGMQNGTDSIVISFTITGKTLNGTDFSFVKTQSLSKSKTGAVGADNQDFGYLAGSLGTVVTPLAAGLLMSDTVFGYHGDIDLGGSAGTAAVIGDFTSYLDSSGNFYLSGDGSGGSLAWDNSANTLAIEGAITITNPENNSSGTSAYYNFGGDGTQVIDTGVFDLTGNIAQHPTSTGIGTADTSGDNAWDSSFRMKQIFYRTDLPVLEWDFKITSITADNHAEMFGWFPTNATGTSTAPLYAVYINANDLYWRYGSTDPTVVSNPFVVGDNWRLRISLKSGGGAIGELFKNGDFTAPAHTYNWTTSTYNSMVAGNIIYDGGTPCVEHQAISLGSPLSVGTTISGNSIATGKIESTNLSTTAGSELALDLGTMKLGGTTAYASTNGIVMDGANAKFAVGNAAGNYIRFNHTADALEINSANFKVDADGNMTLNRSSMLPKSSYKISLANAHFHQAGSTSLFGNINQIAARGYTQTIKPTDPDFYQTNGTGLNNIFEPNRNDIDLYVFDHYWSYPSDGEKAEIVAMFDRGRRCISFSDDSPIASSIVSPDGTTWPIVTDSGGTVTTNTYTWATGSYSAVLPTTSPYIRDTATAINATTGGDTTIREIKEDMGNSAVCIPLSVDGAGLLDASNTTVNCNAILMLNDYGGRWIHCINSLAAFADTVEDRFLDILLGRDPNIESYLKNNTKITGNQIRTGAIQSGNYGTAAGSKIDLTAGTIQMGGSTDPGFNVSSAGLVSATNFSTKSVTVTSTNYLEYTKAVSGGVELVFDGLSADSAGGVAVMHMVISYDVGLIKGFIVPAGLTSGLETEVTIDCNVTGLQYDELIIVRRADAAK